jgi:molybdenum cofactor biosynthesis enzyme MoaA
MTAPDCPFPGLDSLWIQVAGLSCNLRCAHCFNASGPGNRELPSLSREEVKDLLVEAEAAGMRDIVFTGGEPCLHPEMVEIIGDTLIRFPATILTNGTLLTERIVDPFVKTVETGWWTTCLEILPSRERIRGMY